MVKKILPGKNIFCGDLIKNLLQKILINILPGLLNKKYGFTGRFSAGKGECYKGTNNTVIKIKTSILLFIIIFRILIKNKFA